MLCGRENPVDEQDLCLYWTVSSSVLGETRTEELVPGGSTLPVTDENKASYTRAVIEWRSSRGVTAQIASIRTGFRQTIPLEWVQTFDEMQLQMMLSGALTQRVDLRDWRKNTTYKRYTESSKQVLWFWRVVEMELTDEQRLRLLQFVTGTCRLPVGGFAELLGILSFYISHYILHVTLFSPLIFSLFSLSLYSLL